MKKFAKKKAYLALPLIAAAALFAAPAQADVTLYGTMDVMIGATSADDVSTTSFVNNGGMSTSFFGIKGKEDLGNGLNVDFKVESFLRLDQGAQGRFPGDTAFSRNAYVGLSGDFGKVRLGRQTTSLFVSTVAFNPFGDSYTFSPIVLQTFTMPAGKTGISPSVAGDSGWSNAVSYKTPDFGGFTVTGMYSMDETINNTGDKGSISFNYSGGPLASTLTYQRVYSQGNVYQDAAVLGISYDFNVVKVFGQYEWVKNRDSSKYTVYTDPNFKVQSGQIGASIPVGPGNVLASYVYSSSNYSAKNKSSDTRNLFSVGYDYNLSKRTDAYAAVYMDQVDHLSDSSYTYGVGLRHKF